MEDQNESSQGGQDLGVRVPVGLSDPSDSSMTGAPTPEPTPEAGPAQWQRAEAPPSTRPGSARFETGCASGGDGASTCLSRPGSSFPLHFACASCLDLPRRGDICGGGQHPKLPPDAVELTFQVCCQKTQRTTEESACREDGRGDEDSPDSQALHDLREGRKLREDRLKRRSTRDSRDGRNGRGDWRNLPDVRDVRDR
ncbi:hypothetical protein AK812_SmicGene4202 [Symbiodinium microadriaticum]|uniref:Uncharacterized protein n=1 Tax=Symbiodinium microadriaticum TaxID=2951 RepID=A0A1Q9EX10_SYMMI|nr:hypothetical protein AK812_SmicGene4202 [Symbiodinium microadriaticum]